MALLFENLVKTNKGEFIDLVKVYAKQLAINPNWLMMVMFSESTLNEKAVLKNADGSILGGGLIGFISVFTNELFGLSINTLLNMSNVEQLQYVYKFYLHWIKKGATINNYTDLKLVTMYPLANIEKKPDTFIFPQWVYTANPTFDIDFDKKITLGEWKEKVAQSVKLNVPPEFYIDFQHELKRGVGVLIIILGVICVLFGLIVLLYYTYKK
jgi:hypothetical protein